MNVDVSKSVVERAQARARQLEAELSTLKCQVDIAHADVVDAIKQEQSKADEKFPYVLNLTQEQARTVLCIMGLNVSVPRAIGVCSSWASHASHDHLGHTMAVVQDSLFAQNGLKQYLKTRRA
jgi:hypothetical protein